MLPPLSSSARRFAATALCLVFLAGCRRQAVVSAGPVAPAPPRINEILLRSHQVNQAGAVMVIMYHRFDPGKPNTDMNRTPDRFRQDLEGLYKRGYRPVTVSEFVQDRMDVPAGRTPVVLTFDDGYESQFRVATGSDGKPHIDPDCAVGILETFHAQHADWPTKGTFFLLPEQGTQPPPFAQPDSLSEKLGYLLTNGYEIGNHTADHRRMRSLSTERVRWEVAAPVRYFRRVAPRATLQSLAVPYGSLPPREARRLLVSGEYQGTRYANRAVVMAAWRPVMSPVSRRSRRITRGGRFAVFDPYHLERIHPDPRHAREPGTLEYWLAYFDVHPADRYVSGGDPKVVAVPAALKGSIDEARVKAEGKVLQTYSTGPASVAGGSSLSVERRPR